MTKLDEKLSSTYARRLEQAEPTEVVRAVVLLVGPGASGPGSGRQRGAERAAAIAAVRKTAEAALGEVDEILRQHGGRRLNSPNALGSISVDAPPAGILALAASDRVVAVLEDQAVRPLS